MTTTASLPIDTLQRRELAEGVEVELRPAGPIVRAAAMALDCLWLAVIWLLLKAIVLLLGSATGEFGTGVGMLLGFAVSWGYNVVFEAGKRGATPGKRAMKLRVVSESGGPASLSAVMLRNVARTADMMPMGYLTGLLVCLFTRRFQRLGDIVARTLVVYANPADDIPAGKTPPPLPGRKPHPPRVALTREERRAVVRFDERATLWSPARREELAGHASALTQAHGVQGVQELALMAAWLRQS